MARGRHTGKHRAQRGHRLLSSLVVTLSMAAAVAAVVLAVVATDPRLLRAAVAVGLVAALAPVLLPSRRAEPAGPGRDEWRALRRELAELRGELDAYLATS